MVVVVATTTDHPIHIYIYIICIRTLAAPWEFDITYICLFVKEIMFLVRSCTDGRSYHLTTHPHCDIMRWRVVVSIGCFFILLFVISAEAALFSVRQRLPLGDFNVYVLLVLC